MKSNGLNLTSHTTHVVRKHVKFENTNQPTPIEILKKTQDPAGI